MAKRDANVWSTGANVIREPQRRHPLRHQRHGIPEAALNGRERTVHARPRLEQERHQLRKQ